MQVFNRMKILPLFFSFILLFNAGCKKEHIITTVYDNIIFEIDTVPVYASANEKDRLKTPLQYISSLYSNLYFSSIPSNELDNLVIYRLSLGDKNLVNEIILNSMLKDPEVYSSLPSNDDMRSDIDEFINTTYLRFYLRNPTEYEKYGLREIIEEDLTITVIDIYRSFLLSTEYMFY
ncbi:MAG: hypothetical protein H7Y00_08525 [Fimbriimonadaceae bacterium]|nr:hypothetical protein [Chitinophagales bacterium]